MTSHGGFFALVAFLSKDCGLPEDEVLRRTLCVRAFLEELEDKWGRPFGLDDLLFRVRLEWSGPERLLSPWSPDADGPEAVDGLSFEPPCGGQFLVEREWPLGGDEAEPHAGALAWPLIHGCLSRIRETPRGNEGGPVPSSFWVAPLLRGLRRRFHGDALVRILSLDLKKRFMNGESYASSLLREFFALSGRDPKGLAAFVELSLDCPRAGAIEAESGEPGVRLPLAAAAIRLAVRSRGYPWLQSHVGKGLGNFIEEHADWLFLPVNLQGKNLGQELAECGWSPSTPERLSTRLPNGKTLAHAVVRALDPGTPLPHDFPPAALEWEDASRRTVLEEATLAGVILPARYRGERVRGWNSGERLEIYDWMLAGLAAQAYMLRFRMFPRTCPDRNWSLTRDEVAEMEARFIRSALLLADDDRRWDELPERLKRMETLGLRCETIRGSHASPESYFPQLLKALKEFDIPGKVQAVRRGKAMTPGGPEIAGGEPWL